MFWANACIGCSFYLVIILDSWFARFTHMKENFESIIISLGILFAYHCFLVSVRFSGKHGKIWIQKDLRRWQFEKSQPFFSSLLSMDE